MEDYDVTIEAQEKDVMQWLGNFLAMAQGLPPAQVIWSRPPYSATPKPPYIAMTPISSQGLSQPDELWASSGGYMGVRQEVRYDVQLDFFGQDAHSRASKTRTLLRTDWACEYFRRAPFTLQPLTTGTPVETDWAPGEGVYEKRITMMVSLQYNPVVTVTQDYMTNVCPGIKLAEVDSCFPPKD